MYQVGDKVKVIKSKELKKWQNGKEVVNKVGVVTSVVKDGKTIFYFLDDNKYQINFTKESLRKTKEPVSKDVKKEAPKSDVRPGSTDAMPEMPDEIKELLDSLEKTLGVVEKAKTAVKEDLVLEMGKHMVTHCKRIKSLEASNAYMGVAIWILVGYAVIQTVFSLLMR